MSVLLIITDGMADESMPDLNDKTPLEVSDKPTLDALTCMGQTGVLKSVPDAWDVGSDTACLSILGYSLNANYPGRSALEAAQLNISMTEDELVMRCNFITIEDNRISSFTADHISTSEAEVLIETLNQEFSQQPITFFTGNSYRHIIKTKGNAKSLISNSPHNSIQNSKNCLYIEAKDIHSKDTANFLNSIIDQAQIILENHPINISRRQRGLKPANAISFWAPGSNPHFQAFNKLHPFSKGAVISAVDLIKGIGKLIQFKVIEVDGATGQSNTNYEGKVKAALEAVKENDFVILHIEAPDEASHDGDLYLKIKTIEDIDKRVIKPIYLEISQWTTPPLLVILPDHITSTKQKVHLRGDVPFLIYHPSLQPDRTKVFTESAVRDGMFKLNEPLDFMNLISSVHQTLSK